MVDSDIPQRLYTPGANVVKFRFIRQSLGEHRDNRNHAVGRPLADRDEQFCRCEPCRPLAVRKKTSNGRQYTVKQLRLVVGR